LFRSVNSRLAELNADFEKFGLSWLIVCECADRDCIAQMEVTREQFARAQSRERRFIISPACARACHGAARAVERGEHYCIVDIRPSAVQLEDDDVIVARH
jgi:hypothetical protein